MKIKRLSLVILLALCITISGVYAAWIYAEQPLTAVHNHTTLMMANAEVNHPKGTISIDTSGSSLIIDQTADNDYTATLKATGTIFVTLSPSTEFANQNQDLPSITMQYRLVTTNTNPTGFECTDPDDTSKTKSLFNEFNTVTYSLINLVKDGSGKYVGEIPAISLLDCIELNEFVLDKHSKYEKFSADIGTFGQIGVEISEPTP